MTALGTGRPDIAEHLPLIRGKIREVLRQYAGYVDADDLLQEVHLWWLTVDPAVLAEYVADDRQLRLRRTVWRVARDAADRARKQVTPNDSFVQLRYSASEILALIPVALDPDGIPDGGGVQEGPKPHGNLAEGGDIMAAFVDVRRALEQLNGDDVSYLRWMNRLRWDYDRAGGELGIEADSARRRVARICQRMCRFLNGGDN
jgi:hypothetical protein